MRGPMITLIALVLLVGSAAGQDMIEATRAGDLARVQELIAYDSLAVKITDGRNCTPLHFAVDKGHADIVALLLDEGGDLEARDVDGDTPLHWAACTDHVDMIDLLLDRGAEIDALNHRHVTPVLYTTQRMKYALVEKLAKRGADLEVPNDYGRTPLIWTAREGGDLEMARLLLRVGANVDALDRFQSSALELAAWRGFRTLVGILLDAGASTDLRPDMMDALLGHAAESGLDLLYQKLLDDGMHIDVASGDFTNLLHMAAGGGSITIVKDLMDRGAQIEAVDVYGWTPLHHAADRKRGGVARALQTAGCAADLRSLSGHSPLSLARARGAADVIRTLKEAGHTVSRRDFPRLTGIFLGQGVPPAEPAPFALDIVASCWGEHGSISFTPDGHEAFWSGYVDIPDSGYHRATILTSRIEDGRWTPPVVAPFVDEHRGDVPFAAPDGRRVFFLSWRPLEAGGDEGAEHIWVVQRSGDGWSQPRALPPCVNDMPQHWQISVAANGNLYFGSRRPEPDTQGVYISRPVNGVYTEPEYLGFAEDTPYIAPDESYLITSASYGQENVVRFRREDGSWSDPVSISEAYPGVGGICPKISTDGRAFFFISRRTGTNSNFWVDGGFLQELKKRALHSQAGLSR